MSEDDPPITDLGPLPSVPEAFGASTSGRASKVSPHGAVHGPAVLTAVFIIATCGLVYELIAAALASYLLGDSITQFSTVIGAYLSAMGVGAWLSGKVDRAISRRFVEIEIILAVLGGFSSTILFLAFARVDAFRVILYGLVGLVGVLVGLEIPLLMRILKDRYDTKDLVARVLSVDYLGALVASLLFPLFLVPELGLVRSALVMGAINGFVGLWSTYLFRSTLEGHVAARLRFGSILAIILLGAGFVLADRFTSLAEAELYPDRIVYAKTTPYQRIILTRGKSTFNLYLNGNLQFASTDEHRYHEALVHPGFAAHTSSAAPRVLVLGGGDGLAVREILKHPVDSITLVDLDPGMTELALEHPLVRVQNEDALRDPKVRIVHQDAFLFVDDDGQGMFDLAIIDFPDPNNFSLGKLYTKRFYERLSRRLTPEATVVVQATSPLLARTAYWTVIHTIQSAGFFVRGFHANVPTFGEWGYALARRHPFPIPEHIPDGVNLRYLTPKVMASLFEFGSDVAEVPTEINRLDNQVLVRTYESEWSRWF